MRLEPLCVITLDYDDHGLTLVRPFAGQEGQAYGGGTGRVEGERLSGDVRWSNYPRMTDTGVMLPNVRGVIVTEEGPVLFKLQGYSVAPHEGATKRTVTASVNFRTESDAHRWLNQVIAVHDGTIDFTTWSTRFPTYVCIPTDHA